MMRPSTFFFLTRRGVRNLGKHWAMTIACIASLSVCMTLNIFASLAEVNVGSMVAYLGSQNETVVYLDPECDDATAAQVGETLSAMPGVSGISAVKRITNGIERKIFTNLSKILKITLFFKTPFGEVAVRMIPKKSPNTMEIAPDTITM